MRNLRNVKCSIAKYQGDLPLIASGWDTDNNNLICAFGPTKDHSILELRRWKPISKSNAVSPAHFTEAFASWDVQSPLPHKECDEVLDVQYFPDICTVCLVLAGGDIVIVREEPKSDEERIEIVGSVDAGITAASWSPDGELLAITTRAETLLYMTREFDNVANVKFTSDDLKASKHVSVGWGKSETQFKGKGVKVLRDPTMPESVDEGVLSKHDTGNTTISWRGDGTYVAVNSLEANTRRVIRVYSREGTLDSVSEPVNGLTGALSWKPAGSLIASVQRYTDHADVVFFERNGLRHGQFSLRLREQDMETWAADISLHWNVDSSVLAVSFLDRIQLWTMSNYHYYLKNEIFPTLSEHQLTPKSMQWHPEQPLQLVISANGK